MKKLMLLLLIANSAFIFGQVQKSSVDLKRFMSLQRQGDVGNGGNHIAQEVVSAFQAGLSLLYSTKKITLTHFEEIMEKSKNLDIHTIHVTEEVFNQWKEEDEKARYYEIINLKASFSFEVVDLFWNELSWGRKVKLATHEIGSILGLEDADYYWANQIDLGLAENVKGGIVRNLDNSYTIYNPRYVHGNKLLPIYQWTNGMGVCTAFGFKKYLNNTKLIDINNSRFELAKINRKGKFKGKTSNKKMGLIKEVTCYNKRELIFDWDEMIINKDGSYTFKELTSVYGKIVTPVSTYGYPKAICVKLGFLKILDISYKTSNHPHYVIYGSNDNAGSTYFETISYNQKFASYAQEITCYNKREDKFIGTEK